MRNVNAKTSNLSLANLASTSSVINSELSSKAGRNGGGFVYHRSNCGYPNVRFYCCGGDGPGSGCGYWVRNDRTTGGYRESDGKYISVSISDADLVWYGIPEYNIAVTARNVAYKIIGPDHNWSIPDLENYQ
jgi:hypothetical protein